ncbi:50S ribosomal protein L15 [Mongoliitalea lutea]|uniref:Large ribosomal subunit protein uL15 n=1 Tax=Mongoliitalea lutea TaxID=849756 RepID=A0A8J3CZX2_9BACT|nr:50S ribosomal protein L15 [Mongoliitalea lutea]GHB51327.1 50S ribosomal protein L15 [Mongoliitalea lutea]
MKLHTLKPAEGSIKSRKRIGRGTGSGRGGTSTRGHKGAKSRSGYKTKLGFEGGQMPLQRRVPKFGFKSLNKVFAKPINLNTLQDLASEFNLDTITFDTLVEHGLVSKKDVVKVLGRGELTAKLNVSAHSFSASAVEAIEKVGGSVNKI